MIMNDRMTVNQMQAAAAMAAPVIQLQDNSSQPAKTDKGESFQDLMDKAKDQQVEAPKKEAVAETRDPAQKVETPREVEVTQSEDGREIQSVQLAAQEAAMLAAGYAQMTPPQADGLAWLAMPVDENGEAAVPVEAVQDQRALFLNDEWVVEPAPEVAVALEEVLQEYNDPTQASDILGELEQKLQDAALKPQISTGGDTGDVTVDHTGHLGTTPGYFQAPGHSFEEEDNSGELSQMAMSSQEKLFQDVEGTPVKVGEVFELDTQADDMDMQVADLIRSALIQDLNELEVRLTPANLGTVTIKLTQGSDGALSVIIHTSNAKTAALLSEHLDGLNQAIQSTQNREVRVAVQYNEESQQSQYQQTDPDGHNGQQRQQEHHTEEQESGEDFVQRLRLGLVGVEDEA